MKPNNELRNHPKILFKKNQTIKKKNIVHIKDEYRIM